MKFTIPALALAALIAGCGDDAPSTTKTTTTPSAPSSSGHTTSTPSSHTPSSSSSASADRKADGEPRPADNSGKNARDDGSTLTPLDQGQGTEDVKITQTLRSAITDRDGMSFNARNVKIITRDRIVTLRGPVDTADERNWITAAAKAVPGVTRVDDQLELAKR